MAILDQCTHHGVDISRHCHWNAHMNEVVDKSKAQIGRMDAILGDLPLGTRIGGYILMDVMIPKPGYTGEVRKENAKLANK